MIVRPCALQHLALLSLEHRHDLYETPVYEAGYKPLRAVQLPASVSQLRRLHFGEYCDWDALHEALWPLAVAAAAQSAPGYAADPGDAPVGAVPPLAPSWQFPLT